MKKLFVCVILALTASQISANPITIEQDHASRFKLMCYGDLTLDIKQNRASCIRKNQHGQVIQRQKPDLFDLSGKRILFGPGHMQEAIYDDLLIKVSRTTSGMRVSCSQGHLAKIAPTGHLSCLAKVNPHTK